MTKRFEPSFAELPRVIPIFPLTGAVLLPGGMLPLNIFEPRYLSMTQAALASGHRTIGMIQPDGDDAGDSPSVLRTCPKISYRIVLAEGSYFGRLYMNAGCKGS